MRPRVYIIKTCYYFWKPLTNSELGNCCKNSDEMFGVSSDEWWLSAWPCSNACLAACGVCVCQILKEFSLKTAIPQKGAYEDDIGLPKYKVTTIKHYHAPSMVC